MRFFRAATILTALAWQGERLQAQTTAAPFTANDVYSAESTELLDGTIDFKKPGDDNVKPHTFKGERRIRYIERILAAPTATDDIPERVLRVIEKLESTRTIGDSEQVGFPLRDPAKQVVLHRGEAFSKPFSLKGPLKQEEIHTLSHLVFVPALNGLLSKGPLTVGAKWAANRRAVAQLAGLVPMESGDLTCEVISLDYNYEGRRLIQIEFRGLLRGESEEGWASDDVTGALYLDRTDGKIHSLTVDGLRTLYDRDKKTATGRLKMKFKLAVRLQKPPVAADLSDDIAVEAAKDPTPEQTAVLYEFPPCAVKLVHPRPWLLDAVNRTTLTFMYGKEGHQLTINFHEDDKTPTAKEYQQEVEQNLRREKFQNIEWKAEPREQERGTRGAADYERAGVFQATAEKDGHWLMTYWVKQVGKRGVTAAVFLHSQAARDGTLANDAKTILKNLEFTGDRNPFFVKAAAEKGGGEKK